MKRYCAVFLIAVMALSIASSAGVASAKGPTTKTLATPTLVAPANGYGFGVWEDMYLSWKPVKHATDYQLHFKGTWPDGSSQEWYADAGSATSYYYGAAGQHVGATIQWSVQAKNTDTNGGWAGATSAWSDTYSFTF
ncbi:MAG: hypothetical protein ACXV2B_06175 [Halobacteriota archaeon]